MRIVGQSLACVLLVAIFTSCSVEVKKGKNEEEAYNEILRSSEQSSCNDKGKFFDYSIAGESACTNLQLVNWTCNKEGLLSRLVERNETIEEAFEQHLDSEISNGFTFHQCGEIENQAQSPITIILIKKTKEGDKVYVSGRRISSSGLVISLDLDY